jgi:hypothetical protein
VLARAADAPVPAAFDTVVVEFTTSAARVRAGLRERNVDLVWPVPGDVLEQALPAPYQMERLEARPARWLLMVFRCDLPPTLRLAARKALAHGLNRPAVVHALGAAGEAASDWLDPRVPLELPGYDRAAVQEWLARGKLGRSLHVTLGFARGGAGDRVARLVQADWAAQGLDAEVRRLGPEAQVAALRGGGPHVELVEDQPLMDGPRARLAAVVRPMRGAPVGSFRTAWAVRAFDPALWPRGAWRPLNLVAARSALQQDLPVLPLARLPYVWVSRRTTGLPAFHPRFGPAL